MKILIYPKLAARNLHKNAKMYFPYLLTSSIMIMMFYIILSLSNNESYEGTTTGYYLSTIMTLGAAVIGVFSVIFLFYTNSFLIKQRKKEFGLYNILGMEKKHIFKIMLFETIYLWIASFFIGLILGVSFNKLCFLLLQRIITTGVIPGFEISVSAIGVTALLFVGIFLITLIYNLLNIQLANPIQLLRGGNEGEQEPKTQWLSAIIGLISLVSGYYIANIVEQPLEAFALFFVAVVLVIIGTYNLFLAGSILLLKLLRKNKKHYYKTNHFISVSSMIYRMKQNAAGLSSICILATAVLVMISGTLSLYLGMDDAINTRISHGIVINTENENAQELDTAIDTVKAKTGAALGGEKFHSYFSLWGIQQGENFDFTELTDQNNTNSTIINLLVIPLGDYNQIEGTNFELKENEILLGTEATSYEQNTIEIYGLPFSIQNRVDINLRPDNIYIGKGARYLVVVKDLAVMDRLHSEFKQHPLNTALSKYRLPSESQTMYFYGFDITQQNKEIEFYNEITNTLAEKGLAVNIESREMEKIEMMEMYGGFLFLGIFLSILFIVATALIIYYKQITEGYDDKVRYNIMLKVGLSKSEIKSTIKSQILLTFFLPLVTASIHVMAAFKVIRLLLNLLFLYNNWLFALCTIGTILVFSLAYALIYLITSKNYYNIVADVN